MTISETGKETRSRRWMLIGAPAVGFVLLIPVMVIATILGPSIGRWVLIAAITGLLFTSIGAGVALYVDTAQMESADTEWSPTPWWYYFGGAGVFMLIALPSAGQSAGAGVLIGSIIGTILASFIYSPVIAGPVYLWRRHKYVGTP